MAMLHPLTSLFILPYGIRKDILVYSFPLFLMSLSRKTNDNSRFSDTIVGSLIALVITKRIYSKTSLILSSILYLTQLFVPSLYFYVYGFMIHQAYNTNITVSKNEISDRLIVRIEVLGWIISEIVEVPRLLRLIFGGMAVLMALRSDSPSLETEDPYESLKMKIDQPKLLNQEYREVINYIKTRDARTKWYEDLTPFVLEPFYMISDRKILLLFCSFFCFEYSEILVIFTGILFVFDFYWEWGILLQKTSGSRRGIVRCIWTFIIYKIIITIKNFIHY